MQKLKIFITDLIVFAVLFISVAALFMLIRTNMIWGNVSIEQILINMVEANNLAAKQIMHEYILYTLLPAIVICFLLQCVIKHYRWLLLISLLCLAYCSFKLDLVSYIRNQHVYSELYEQEYVNPEDISFHFPENKQNLIIIHMESMEKNYADANLSGENLLPGLTELSKYGLSFDDFYQLQHQDYTLAGMIASYCAVPYKSIKNTNYTMFNNFMPALVCLPQVLQQNGYNTYFMKGATLDFSRTGIFFSSHGMKDLVGQDELATRFGLDPEINRGSQWGFKDSILYSLAKNRLTEIAKNNQPFLFSMLTVDNHGPNLFVDNQCLTTQNPQKDVIRCADKMVVDFVKWIMSQSFYQNTTVVIVGDHIKTGLNNLYPNEKNRQIVNLILNPKNKNLTAYDHRWTTLDLSPSILQAIGVDFADGKFGLGRSLFESSPTLLDKLGPELDNELHKASKVYEQFNTIVKTFTPLYNAYPQWGTSLDTPEMLQTYASFSDEEFNLLWLDTLSFTLPQTTADTITLNMQFKILFMANLARNIEVFANNQKIASWSFKYDVKQPITKTLTFNRNLLTDDNKLLLEFKADTPGASFVSVGLGIKSFRLDNN